MSLCDCAFLFLSPLPVRNIALYCLNTENTRRLDSLAAQLQNGANRAMHDKSGMLIATVPFITNWIVRARFSVQRGDWGDEIAFRVHGNRSEYLNVGGEKVDVVQRLRVLMNPMTGQTNPFSNDSWNSLVSKLLFGFSPPFFVCI